VAIITKLVEVGRAGVVPENNPGFRPLRRSAIGALDASRPLGSAAGIMIFVALCVRPAQSDFVGKLVPVEVPASSYTLQKRGQHRRRRRLKTVQLLSVHWGRTVNSSIASSETLYPPKLRYSYAPKSKLEAAVQLGVRLAYVDDLTSTSLR
jgi:hypothetical protein